MNIPSIGRVLHFFPHAQWAEEGGSPFPCLICSASPDQTRVIVGGFTDEGVPFSCKNVPVIQDGQVIPEEGSFCVWPKQPAAQPQNSARSTIIVGG